MKCASYVISCALSLGLGVDSAFADVITINVTAHILGIVDKAGVFPGLAGGQPVTATYSYDTGTPQETKTTPGRYGFYRPASPPASVKVCAGPYTFQSLATSDFQITVVPGFGDARQGSFYVDAINVQPLARGATIDRIEFAFFGRDWPTSNALPTGAPAMQNLSSGDIIVKDTSTDSQVIVQIDSITLASAP
jgi:hypothetical protein